MYINRRCNYINPGVDQSIDMRKGVSTKVNKRDTKMSNSFVTLKCEGKTFTSKIGKFTADEMAFARDKVKSSDMNCYLNDNAADNWWWSLFLSFFGGKDIGFFMGGGSGSGDMLYNMVNSIFGLRSVISLVSKTEISCGGW